MMNDDTGGYQADALPTEDDRGKDPGVLCKTPKGDKYVVKPEAKKKCLVIYVEDLSTLLDINVPEQQKRQQMEKRVKIINTFDEILKYECEVIGIEKSKHEDIIAKLREYRDRLGECGLLVIWLLTYRTECQDEGRRLYAYDRQITPHEISEAFLGNSCQALASVPKLFFIDAQYLEKPSPKHLADRRGQEAADGSYRLPITANFLFSMSPFVKKDTEYVDICCNAIKNNVEGRLDGDIIDVLTFVAREAAIDDVTSTHISTLTNTLHLKPTS